MKKIVNIFLISALLISVISSASSCALIEKHFNTRDQSVPAHECEQYSVWKIEKYSTETKKGTKNLVCDYCGKTLSSADVPLLSIGLAYEVREDGVWITGVGDCTDANLVIPEQIGGKDVVGIADTAFQKNTFITSVVMPITLKNVGIAAFDGATSLADVIFGSNLERLGWLSFRGCAITSLYVPGSVSGYYDMDAYTFSSCNSLKNVVLGEGIQRLAGTFEYCSSLEFISLPSTLVSIENAFYQSKNLKTVNFRGHIGQYCELEKTENFLTLAETYPTFYNATVLVGGVDIPENIVIPEGTTKIAFRAFLGMDIKSVKMPDSVTSIGYEAFANCESLESVEFGKGLKTIGYYAFRSCQKLKEIKIHDGIETIGHSAFYGCRAVEHVEIGEGLQVLKARTLGSLLSLETLKLPSTLTKYEYPLFSSNTKLNTVYYGGTMEQWFAFIQSSGYHCDDFDMVRVYCADGEIYNNKIVEK